MSEKKYSYEDVKRIVQEALKQAKEQENQRIIKEAMAQEQEETDQDNEDDDWDVSTHWKKSENKDFDPNKPIVVKDKTLSEIRTGCAVIVLASILGFVAFMPSL